MESKTTHLYDIEEFDKALVEAILTEVRDALKDKGYDPINQLTGYLMSGDPGYISSHKEARNKITKFERTRVLEVLVDNFIK